MHNTIFTNSAVRRFASVISIFLVTVAFLWTVPSDATTNVGTAGATVSENWSRGAGGQFGGVRSAGLPTMPPPSTGIQPD